MKLYGTPVHHQDMKIGRITDNKEIPVELRDDKREFGIMLVFYIKHYFDRTLPKRMKQMPLNVAKKLYNDGNVSPRIVFNDKLLEQTMDGPVVTSTQKIPNARNIEVLNKLLYATRVMVSATYDRKHFIKALRGETRERLMMGRSTPLASVVFMSYRKLLRIYNRFHKDQFNVDHRYLVMLKHTKTWDDHGTKLKAHAIYDRQGEGLAVSLLEAVNNPFWQMDKKTAEKVAKRVHERLFNKSVKLTGQQYATDVGVFKVDSKLIAKAKSEPMKYNQ